MTFNAPKLGALGEGAKTHSLCLGYRPDDLLKIPRESLQREQLRVEIFDASNDLFQTILVYTGLLVFPLKPVVTFWQL